MSDDERSARHAGRTADPNFTPTTSAERAAHEQGEKERYDNVIANAPRGGGGAAAGLAFVGMYMALLWPLVLALTLVAGYFAWQAVQSMRETHPFVFLLVPALAGGVGLYVGVKIERVLERSQLYRGLRHIARLIVVLIGATWLMLQYPGTPPIPPDVTLEWIDDHLSPFRVLLILALVILTQILSARMDNELRDAYGQEDVDYSIEDEGRSDRWWRRGRSLVFCALVGAALVPALRFPNDNLPPAFVFGGAFGVVFSRWLYPWWIHPIWRFRPWVYFGTQGRKRKAYLDYIARR